MRATINKPDWVGKQYASDSNLNARIALHTRFSTSKVEWTHWVFDQIWAQLEDVQEEFLCLYEVGAGPANLWAENRHRLPDCWRVTLSDLSPGMALSASRNLASAGVQANVLVAGAEEIPVASSTCQAVIANHMLYHVANRGNALAEIRRILVKDGVLVAATNGETHMHELHELIARFDPAYAMDDSIPRQFSLQNGVEQLGEFFSDVRVALNSNELLVTEVEPIVAYLLSGVHVDVPKERVESLRAFVSDEMAKEGVIRITPETGLLIARR